MSTLNAFDYAWSRPDPHEMRAAGILVVARYLSGDPSKNISPAEKAALDAAGIGVAWNWESSNSGARNGARQGSADGNEAAVQAKAAGAKAGEAIYASVDFEIGEADWPAVLDYARAFKASTGAYGFVGRAYGQFALIERLAAEGIADWGWQTLAWSDGQISAHAALYQFQIDQKFNGADVDYNEIRNAPALLASWPAGASPEGSGVAITSQSPAKSEEDEPLKLDTDDFEKIKTDVTADLTTWLRSAEFKKIIATTVWGAVISNPAVGLGKASATAVLGDIIGNVHKLVKGK